MSEIGELQAIFAKVGEEFGYRSVQASYRPFKEMKSTWWRSGSVIVFQISDYIKEADESLKESFARSLFSRISNGRRMTYHDNMREWLRSPEFLSRNRPLYLDRSRNLALNAKGDTYNLDLLRKDLVRKGLISHDGDIYLTWTKRANRKRVGYCSVLMGVVAISSALDSAGVPPYVPEYVLYHELLHMEMGTDSLSPRHDAEFRRREREHPRWKDAEHWLRKIASRR